MQTGLDRLLRHHSALIKKKKIGLLAHPASVDKNLRHLFEILREEKSCELVALFGPEHGFFGQAQDMESVGNERQGSIPIYSLYGSKLESLKPTRASLENVEV